MFPTFPSLRRQQRRDSSHHQLTAPEPSKTYRNKVNPASSPVQKPGKRVQGRFPSSSHSSPALLGTERGRRDTITPLTPRAPSTCRLMKKQQNPTTAKRIHTRGVTGNRCVFERLAARGRQLPFYEKKKKKLHNRHYHHGKNAKPRGLAAVQHRAQRCRHNINQFIRASCFMFRHPWGFQTYMEAFTDRDI